MNEEEDTKQNIDDELVNAVFNDKKIGLRVKGYVALYRTIRREAHSDNVALQVLHEVAKDFRMEKIEQQKREQELKATPKQIAWLKSNGVEIPEKGLTKKEASELIDKNKK